MCVCVGGLGKKYIIREWLMWLFIIQAEICRALKTERGGCCCLESSGSLEMEFHFPRTSDFSLKALNWLVAQ
jgi:hypothetical protein